MVIPCSLYSGKKVDEKAKEGHKYNAFNKHAWIMKIYRMVTVKKHEKSQCSQLHGRRILPLWGHQVH